MISRRTQRKLSKRAQRLLNSPMLSDEDVADGIRNFLEKCGLGSQTRVDVTDESGCRIVTVYNNKSWLSRHR